LLFRLEGWRGGDISESSSLNQESKPTMLSSKSSVSLGTTLPKSKSSNREIIFTEINGLPLEKNLSGPNLPTLDQSAITHSLIFSEYASSWRSWTAAVCPRSYCNERRIWIMSISEEVTPTICPTSSLKTPPTYATALTRKRPRRAHHTYSYHGSRHFDQQPSIVQPHRMTETPQS